ncbi:MAG: transcriptional repressor [Synergistaceae bacterium]|jgi:Fur family ferric uptake transcriptional regulator|nr:transcriptional repressor [Synergistaceae bacterium]
MTYDKGAAAEKQKRACRNTKQKKLILDCLVSDSGHHFTADEIVDILKSRRTPVAKSTVYRALAMLEESGEVRKYFLSEFNSACYQFVADPKACAEHYHLMCVACGKVVHFESAELRRAFQAIRSAQKPGGFFVDGLRTVFYGRCGECSAK